MNRSISTRTHFGGAILSLSLCLSFSVDCSAQPALPDSTRAKSAAPDSVAVSPKRADRDATLLEISPWARTTSRTLTDAGRRPTTLADALRWRSSVALRESGDPGARAFLSLSPVDAGAPELFIDGAPTRNPADVCPSIYDQSYIPLRALRASDARWDVGGPFALHGEFDAALEGRTRLRSHFASTANETYYRGLSWSTPRAPRTLRFDYEEWKTEEGYASFVASETRPSRFGRAKQRRFELSGQASSSVGTLSLRFGRGRRYHDGRLLGSAPEAGLLERWTGTLVAGIDRGDSTSHTRLRLFHLDWQDIDAAHGFQTRDAVRTGVRAQRSRLGGGWSWLMEAERQAAAFVDGTGENSRPDEVYLARLAVGHDGGSDWRRSLRAEIAANDATAQRADVGAAVLLRRSVGAVRMSVGAERRLRMPTPMEIGGTWQTDFADGLHRRLIGGGELPIERQDRLHVGVEGTLREFEWEVLSEEWWLRRGVGWQIESDSVARYVGGAELDAPVAQLRVRRNFGQTRRGIVAEAQASHLLDAPSVDRSRGAGWPRSWAGGSVTAWTRVVRDYNRFSLRYSFRASEGRFDDLLTPFAPGSSSTVLPRESRHDLQLTLRIRDAELYLIFENLTDATLQEVSATQLRGRQRVWGLYWNFYN